VVNATVPEKKPSRIVNPAGSASTAKLSRQLSPRLKVFHATVHRKKRRGIAYPRVGAASRERSSKVRGKIVRRGAVNGTLPKKRRKAIVLAISVGAALTQPPA
jgi:hypothetical protein